MKWAAASCWTPGTSLYAHARGCVQEFGDTSVSGLNFHPTLMALAFQVLAPEALLAFRTSQCLSRWWRKAFHGILNGLFLFFAVRQRREGGIVWMALSRTHVAVHNRSWEQSL